MSVGMFGFGYGMSMLGSFTPLLIPNCAEWHRADLGVTIATGVSSWADQSGHGITLSQGTGANQPTFFSAPTGFNGFPAIGNTGAGTLWLDSGAISIADPAWIFMAFRVPATPATTLFLRLNTSNGSTNSHGITVNSSMVLNLLDGGGTVAGPTLSLNTTYIAAFRHISGANNSQILLNHWSTTAATGTLTGETELSIRCINASTVGAQCQIAEQIEYSRDLTTAERQSVVQYLGARYNVPVSA